MTCVQCLAVLIIIYYNLLFAVRLMFIIYIIYLVII